jgi:hypothetical protein
MTGIGAVLRFAAFVFNLVVALWAFLLALVVFSSGRHNIQLSIVPLTGKNLTLILLLASIYAFVAMVLALRRGRWVRLPMLLWNLVVALLLVTTPLRGGFSFQGKDQLTFGLYLGAAAVLALLGAWLQWRQGGRRK